MNDTNRIMAVRTLNARVTIRATVGGSIAVAISAFSTSMTPPLPGQIFQKEAFSFSLLACHCFCFSFSQNNNLHVPEIVTPILELQCTSPSTKRSQDLRSFFRKHFLFRLIKVYIIRNYHKPEGYNIHPKLYIEWRTVKHWRYFCYILDTEGFLFLFFFVLSEKWFVDLCSH